MTVYESQYYRIDASPTTKGTIHVQVKPKGPYNYWGPGPCFRICHPEPCWWKPWTWGRSVEGAVKRAKRWIAKREEKRRRAEEIVYSMERDN